MQPLCVTGCRHDIFGHYLKAIGLLRVLALCAEQKHRDPEAEGWWDLGQACFVLRSAKYPTIEALAEFFGKRYRPTPVFSAWNTGGGLDEKKQVAFRIDPEPWNEYWRANRDALLEHGFPPPADGGTATFPEKPFTLKLPQCSLPTTKDIEVRRTKDKVRIAWSKAACAKLFAQMEAKREILEHAIKFTKPVKEKFKSGKPEFEFDVMDESALACLTMPGVNISLRIKESGKKAVMALLAKEMADDADLIRDLELGRRYFDSFQDEAADDRVLLEEYRDQSSQSAAEAFDAIFTTRASARPADNPVFLNRGDAGNAEVFRNFWVFFRESREAARFNTLASLCGVLQEGATVPRGKGSPFFPDTIKSYNIGSGWIEEEYPFYPLDYVLAVEGGFALRGSAARTIGASTRRFAAFPFVFDSAEDMVDDGNDVRGTASALWLPFWQRPTTFAELSSFIGDAQARLPGKDARFSAEFVRALYAQGVDAGLSGWQEFRFKMKGSRVPWITTGRYVNAYESGEEGFEDTRRSATLLNLALAPLDVSRFLDQFEIAWSGNKVDSRSPHSVRTEINEAMETAALEPTPDNCLALLDAIFGACRRMCASESFRERLRGGRASFFVPLPMKEWADLLSPLNGRPDFRIARALASIAGSPRLDNGERPATQPALGSLLPLKLGRSGWYLPEKGERQQCVWTGEDLSRDLAAVFRRRYLDSLDDEFPALRGVHGARLDDVMAFLRGELDDFLIARWTEALSLIGWHFASAQAENTQDSFDETAAPFRMENQSESLDMNYAALRTLLELECEWQGNDRSQWKKRRSQQPFALMCERSAMSLPSAVSEALRWISIWGVPNPWGAAARAEEPRVAGRYIINLTHTDISPTIYAHQMAGRLAAAVCIPLCWQDRYRLYQGVTLPPGVD
ncbi:MAG TPA: type I-U CRISPR-associated protein Csx17 [Bryobacteraceae bacterium]|nr:type I-U CRISPR-associated protein Csx17 [Bryobacteraceae bacterium]